MSEFIYNLAHGRMMHMMAEENCRKERLKAQFKRRSFHVSHLINTYLG